jgi:hypothetical protein
MNLTATTSPNATQVITSATRNRLCALRQRLVSDVISCSADFTTKDNILNLIMQIDALLNNHSKECNT